MDGDIGRRALIRTHFRSGILIVLMLVSAVAFFVAGIFLPFTSVTKLWLFQNQISVYHGLIILWQAGELFLAVSGGGGEYDSPSHGVGH